MNKPATPLQKPIVLGITGASGAIYAIRLLETLLRQSIPVHLIISESGAAVVQQELDLRPALDGSNIGSILNASDALLNIPDDESLSSDQLQECVQTGLLQTHLHNDFFAPMASGSFLTGGMVVCPCSGSTLSNISHAASNNLIQRAADVHLKEHRKLIVVPRETPLSSLQLENMHRLAQAGAVVLPASPGWYYGAKSLRDLVDFIVARILDQLNIDHALVPRWAEGKR